jgi:menaquinol-cytochrome c reductase iron-sulfur subunit
MAHDQIDQERLECRQHGRRSLLRWASMAIGGLAAASLGIPVIGYLLGPWLRQRPDKWVDAGTVDSFAVGQTRLVTMNNPVVRPWSGMSGRIAAYVRRDPMQGFTVFSVNCTHLGCPVSWFPQSGLFLCPCHGGVYYADGSRASGPPPRGLYKLPHKVVKGRLQIQIGHLPTLSEPA